MSTTYSKISQKIIIIVTDNNRRRESERQRTMKQIWHIVNIWRDWVNCVQKFFGLLVQLFYKFGIIFHEKGF